MISLVKMFDVHTKNASGYVEVEAFADAKAGYCCGTCKFARPTHGKSGTCALHLYDVKTYGCCNQWQIGARDALLGYDGKRLHLRVLR